MQTINAAARLMAADEGVANKAHYEQKISSGEIKIVEGAGKRYQAGKLPNGRYCVLDMGVTGDRSPLMAAGLDEARAKQAVQKGNKEGKLHPAHI